MNRDSANSLCDPVSLQQQHDDSRCIILPAAQCSSGSPGSSPRKQKKPSVFGTPRRSPPKQMKKSRFLPKKIVSSSEEGLNKLTSKLAGLMLPHATLGKDEGDESRSFISLSSRSSSDGAAPKSFISPRDEHQEKKASFESPRKQMKKAVSWKQEKRTTSECPRKQMKKAVSWKIGGRSEERRNAMDLNLSSLSLDAGDQEQDDDDDSISLFSFSARGLTDHQRIPSPRKKKKPSAPRRNRRKQKKSNARKQAGSSSPSDKEQERAKLDSKMDGVNLLLEQQKFSKMSWEVDKPGKKICRKPKLSKANSEPLLQSSYSSIECLSWHASSSDLSTGSLYSVQGTVWYPRSVRSVPHLELDIKSTA